MRDAIIQAIRELELKKIAENRFPNNHTEFELKNSISHMFEKELESLINEGVVTVTGITINKSRLLTLR